MFQVIQPSQGDYTVQLPLTDGCGLIFRILLPGIFQFSSAGIGSRPHTWGRDKFNNSNCSHLNVRGNVFTLPASGGNIVVLPDKVNLPWPGYSGNVVPQLKVGTSTCSDIIPRGVSCYRSCRFLYGSQHYYIWMSLDWVSDRKIRFCYGRSLRSSPTGVPSVNTLTVYYIELRGTMFQWKTLARSFSPSAKIPDWINPTEAWTTFGRVELTGSFHPIPFISTADLVRRTSKWREDNRKNDFSSFGSLSIDAVQSLKVFDGQLSLFLRDVLDVKSIVSSFWELLRSPALKTASSAYLSYRYGLKLTVNDLRNLTSSFRSLEQGKKGYNSSRARLQGVSSYPFSGRNVSVSHDYTMKLYVRDFPNHAIQMMQQMMLADFFPTLELAWDMIPFSFVVDWFIRIGDVLEAIDSNTLLSTYKVLSCVYSRRSTCLVKIGDLFPNLNGVLYGELEVIDYHRFVSNTPPPFYLDFLTPRSFNHYLEGAALIAQRSRV